MRRFLSLAVLGAALWASPAAFGQPTRPDRPGEDARKLEADLDRLRAQVRELEARLARSKETAPRARTDGRGGPPEPAPSPRAKGDERGPRAKDPGRRGPPEQAPSPRAKGNDRSPGERGGFGGPKGGLGGFGPPMGGPGGFGRSGPGPGWSRDDRWGPPGGPRGRDPRPDPAELSRRLDRIIGELDQLRRDIDRQNR